MHRRILPLLLPLVLTGCARGRTAAPSVQRIVVVRLAPVTVERIARPVTATGVLGPKEEVPLAFKVGGVIGHVLVDEGQTVRTGDTLAILDLSEIDAGVTRARSAAEKAERDLTRTQRLYTDSVATLEQLQNAATGRDIAAAELETVTFNRRYALIVAPASGVILRRNAEPGELIQAGTPILTLGTRTRSVVMRVALADRDVVRVQRGDHAMVRFDALPDVMLEGTTTEIGAAADPLTGTYRVEITLPRAARLASGLVGQVEIQARAAEALSLVPVEAVLEADGSRATVFTLSADGRHAERRSVRVAFLIGDRVAIVAGLEGARWVVTDGAAYLDDGVAVRVQP